MRWKSMHMKSRVTLTLEPKISHQAKIAARARGMSFSGLVERLLLDELKGSPAARARQSFSQRWNGRLSVSPKAGARFEKLRKKHAL